MASSYFFAGRLWTTPATMTQIDDTAMAPTSLTVGNVLAIIGNCTGGQPNAALKFGNPSDADAMLVSGELHDMVMKAFNPSDDEDVNAPSTVIAVRVGSGTQASVVLEDNTAQQAIVFNSAQWGLPANQVKIKVEAGSLQGLRLTTQVGSSYCVGDNLARDAFEVQYLGGGVGTMTVGNTSVELLVNGVPVSTIPLATYPTVEQLVDVINSVSGFSATVAFGSDATASLNGLDAASNVNVTTNPYTATANLQACIDWLNSAAQVYGTASRPAAAGLPPALIGWTYLTGGTANAVQMQDWANALTVLQGVDVQWLAVLSPLPAVAAAADAHAQFMSQVGRKERRAFSGPALGTTVAQVEALPIALNSDRSAICWPGYYDYNPAGVLTLYAPYMTAALVAAAFAGADPGTPMTNHTLTVRGLELSPNNPTDTDGLIQSGVLCLESTTEGYKVVRSVSTWLQNNNFNRVEISCGAATDFTARNVRQAVDILRGQRADPRLLARAMSITDSALKALSQPQPQGPGVLVGDANSPPYKNITATITGDVVQVAFECSPVIPANFFPITMSIQPYSGTASS